MYLLSWKQGWDGEGHRIVNYHKEMYYSECFAVYFFCQKEGIDEKMNSQVFILIMQKGTKQNVQDTQCVIRSMADSSKWL